MVTLRSEEENKYGREKEKEMTISKKRKKGKVIQNLHNVL